MQYLERKALVFLLIALSALASASPVLGEDVKPSKPLNLLAGARHAAAAPTPRPQAVPIPVANPIRDAIWAVEDATPLITGAASAPASPPPPPPPAPRPTKTGGPTPPAKTAPPAAGPADNEIAQFCGSVADPAIDARLAWQLKELEKAETLLRERIAEVEAKRAEYEKWMTLRDEFLKKAEASVVEIYSRMKPEAAATQIAGMADDTAAAVLAKLTPRNASAIFNEMDPARAAHLADLLGGMRRVDEGKSRP